MLKWLFSGKPTNDVAASVTKAEVSAPAETYEERKSRLKKEEKARRATKPCIGRDRDLNPKRVVSVEPAKAGDELVTLNPHYKDPRWKHDPCGCQPEQYLRRKDSRWYQFPEFRLIESAYFERLYEEYKLRNLYETETPLMIAIQSRQSEVKCIYCHSHLLAKAQVCLKCGGFLCLACAPTVEKCPTLGCAN